LSSDNLKIDRDKEGYVEAEVDCPLSFELGVTVKDGVGLQRLHGKVFYKGTIRELRFYLDNRVKLIRIIKLVEFERKIEGVKLFGKSVEVWSSSYI
jgi:hypothetical protein